MQAPPLVVLQFAPGVAFVSVSRVPGGHGGGGGDGGDGGGDRVDGGGGGRGGSDGGGDGGAGDAQITKPPAAILSSLYHAIVSPAAITTSLGPLLREYRVPPMVI